MAAPTPNWEQIFENSFKDAALDFGYPMWRPQPSSSNNHVTIGDVGYLFNGEFHRVLNITEPGGNRSALKFQPGDIERETHTLESAASSASPQASTSTPTGISEDQPGVQTQPRPLSAPAITKTPSFTQSFITSLRIPSVVTNAMRSPTVPQTPTPLVSQDTPTTHGNTKPITSKGVEYEGFTSGNGVRMYKFRLINALSGAIIIPLSTLKAEYLAPSKVSEWKRFMANNLNDWPEPEACTRRDLILIHGRVMTSEWAILVFDKWNRGVQDTFEVVIKDSPSPEDDGVRREDCAMFETRPYFRRGRDVLSRIKSTSTEDSSSVISDHCLFYRGLRPVGTRGLFSGWAIEEVPRPQSASVLIKRTTSSQARNGDSEPQNPDSASAV